MDLYASTDKMVFLQVQSIRGNGSENSLNIAIKRVTVGQASQVAELIGELLHEIMDIAGIQAFSFDHKESTARLQEFMTEEKYIVFLASSVADSAKLGVLTLCESYALYAAGSFGIIPEFYVRPGVRSSGVGKLLLDTAKAYAQSRGWKQLEVTTPPLPEFDRTLAFYAREGFAVTGGRKLKLRLSE
jgi:GNAT superfamily N-acetyltransferase